MSREFLYFIAGSGTDKWLPALVAFRILCVYGIVFAVLDPAGNVAIVSGRPKILFKANLLAGAVEVTLLYPVLRYLGIEGVAALVTFTYALQCFVYMPYLKRQIGIEYRTVFAILQPALISGACAYIICLVLQPFLPFSILGLVLKLLIVACAYFVICGFITRWRLIRESASLIRTALHTPGAV